MDADQDDDFALGPDVEAMLERERARPWPGPDLYTLRGWVEVEVALGGDVVLDAAHAMLSDAAQRAFGPRVFDWVVEELAAEGRDPDDLAALIRDDRLADRVLTRLRERMADDQDAPDPPTTDLSWSAFPPDDPDGGGGRFRRAVRSRAADARAGMVPRRRPRIAGRRDR